ncbi:MAG: phage portal protein [Mogibacterium diversum]|uniref:phage portal protein n=1 Tax=Mogibacterium diversum TaxID=114527 RepID=UPI001CB06AEA|nr:phage portal protein [Mogibacterium diversum]MBF1340759.1 phage portal protein [Mogibacterium diversum]
MLTEQEIRYFISDDAGSQCKRKSREAQRYYEGEHDILNYRMFYYNSDGELVEDTTRSNIKISHPFFTELVDQQVQYMLSGDDSFVRSDVEGLQSKLDEYFDEDFKAELTDLLTGTITKGFDYLFAYQNEHDRLAFQYADSLGVIEVRAKDTDDNCNYVIYWYIDRIAKNNKVIKRIQVWDDEKTTYYVQNDEGGIDLDESVDINPRPHVIYERDNSLYYKPFGFIPFFRLDNNKKQISNLKAIKGIIDDYDIMSCGLSNNLADFDHPLHVVRGFEGDNLDELSQNLKTKKTIGVDSEGGVEVHTVDIPYQARLTKMEQDEKNIYRFGMGFNSAQIGDGNITNIVIKSRYALLDLKCNKLEIKLKQFLKKIVKVVIDEINKKNNSAYKVEDVWFDFKREVMTNASDNAQIYKTEAETKQIEINTILGLHGVIDDKNVIKSICDVLELDYEEVKNNIPDEFEDDPLKVLGDE